MTPNNKSECCSKCAWQNENRPIHCIDKDCPCHVGDSLRKQEEKCCEKCLWQNEDRPPHCIVKDCNCHTPKVATSEKERCVCGEEITFGAEVEVGGICHRTKNPCYVISDFNRSELVTPHESEDWEAEWEKIKANFIAVKQGEWWSSDEDFIKDFIRKVCQRGREEGVHQGYIQGYQETRKSYEEVQIPHAKQMGREEVSFADKPAYSQNELDLMLAQVRDSILSLAVQEIEKEKSDILAKQVGNSGFTSGKISGLDKAQSIISGVMKK